MSLLRFSTQIVESNQCLTYKLFSHVVSLKWCHDTYYKILQNVTKWLQHLWYIVLLSIQKHAMLQFFLVYFPCTNKDEIDWLDIIEYKQLKHTNHYIIGKSYCIVLLRLASGIRYRKTM